MKLLEEKRQLTSKEREYILNLWAQQEEEKKQKPWLLPLIYAIGIVCVGVLFWMAKEVCLLLGVWAVGMIVWILLCVKILRKKVRNHSIMVKEAIFCYTSRQSVQEFKINRRGKQRLYSRTATLEKSIKEGDKVIILSVFGTKWVFPALEDNDRSV